MQSKDSVLVRWRLILGGEQADGTDADLSDAEKRMDAALGALYEYEHKQRFEYGDTSGKQRGGSGMSQPTIARWLGDIRRYFPQTVVEIMQQDALRQPLLRDKMLLESDMLEQAAPDVHLVATLLELGKMVPAQTKESARKVVQRVAEALLEKLQFQTVQALTGALHRSVRVRRAKWSDVNWSATLRQNLKHYQPNYQTLIPVERIGYGRKTRQTLQEIVICLDQSGSMGTSVVYAAIFAAVLAQLPALRTRFVTFDTNVADLTEALQDPVELLFGVQLGGGTDIAQALRYCQQQLSEPQKTLLVLISDLYEGAPPDVFCQAVTDLVDKGVQLVGLLALNDEGAPVYDAQNARFLAQQGIPVFACTPDQFPDLMAAVIHRHDLSQWAGERGIVLKGR